MQQSLQKLKYYPLILILFVASCNLQDGDKERKRETPIKSGHWLVTFNIGNERIPVNAFFSDKNDSSIFVFKNGNEVIKTRNVYFIGDSLFITLPVFGTYFQAKVVNDSTIQGVWNNTTKSYEYLLPFTARHNNQERFESSGDAVVDVSGKWEVLFGELPSEQYVALGLFNQIDNKVEGTFLTESGDYRFLEGIIDGDQLNLSCFDGAHVFLFKSNIDSNGVMYGQFWSGNHYQKSWTAERNPTFELTHPDSLTTITDSLYEGELNFVDLQNNPVSLDYYLSQNKVLIVQIMGSWCPNCMDESRDFSMLYEKYHDAGLEVVAIAYERSDNLTISAEIIERFKTEVGANYVFLFGGKADREINGRDFPMIDGISSFPTTLFFDRSGKLRKVSTGYYGPGTGEYYNKYLSENESFIQMLLAEDISS